MDLGFFDVCKEKDEGSIVIMTIYRVNINKEYHNGKQNLPLPRSYERQ